MVTKDNIDELVFQLSAIFPAWNNAIQSTEQANNLKRVWFTHLNDMGLTSQDLLRGLKKARMQESGFLPSLGQFASWCQATGLPTKHQAWQIAANANELRPITNPLVLEAANRTKQFDIRNRNERDVKPLFFDHYADVLREHSEGVRFELPPPPPKKQISNDRKPAQRSPEADKKIKEILSGVFDDTQS